MHFISHGLASILIYRVLDVLFPNLFPHTQVPWLLTAFIFGVIPDIDALAIKNLRDHHKSPMHWPAIWVLLLVSTFIFRSFLGELWFATLILFSTLILVHICLDYIAGRTAGVQLLFPFSKKEMSLCPLHKEKGKFSPKTIKKKALFEYLEFYVQNKALFLFELFIILAGLVALIFR